MVEDLLLRPSELMNAYYFRPNTVYTYLKQNNSLNFKYFDKLYIKVELNVFDL